MVFEKIGGMIGCEEWVRREVYGEHTHEPDHTILSNEIINYIDDLVTGRGCNITPIEVLSQLRLKFSREFDVPSLFHHLSQRFDIIHKSDNVEFVKDYVKEYPTELRDSSLDEVQVY